MKKISGCLGALALTICLVGLVPQNSHAEGVFPETLTKDNIIVSGNKRTKDSFLKNTIISCSEQGKNVVLIKQCLESTQYFKEIEVSVNEQNQLVVSLKDKLTFLGFPIIQGPDPDTGAEGSSGLVLFDVNSEGRGNLFIFFAEQRMPSGKSSYNLDYTFNYLGERRSNSLGLRAYQQSYLHQQYSDLSWIYGTEEDSSGLDVTFSHFAGPAKLDWSLGYTSSKFTENFHITNSEKPLEDENRILNPKELADELVTFTKTGIGFGYSLANAGQGSYYTSGGLFNQKLSVDLYDFTEDEDANEDNDDSDDPEPTDIKLETKFYLGVPTVRNQVFQLYLKHEARQNDNAWGSYRVGGVLGSRSLPNNGIWGKEYGFITMEYQMPILQRKVAIWTVAPFIENGYATGIPTHTNANPDIDLTDSTNWLTSGWATYVHFPSGFIPSISFYIGANRHHGSASIIIGQAF